MLRKDFAHPDEAQIGEVGRPIRITVGEPGELVEMVAAVKRQRNQRPSFSIASATAVLLR